MLVVSLDESVTTKVLGTVKWLNVKNGYGFIKSWHDGSLCPLLKMAIKKNNPRKYLRSVGNGETVAFDMVEGEKVSLPVGLGYPSTRSKYAADRNHYRQYPRQQGPQHTYPGNCPNGGSKTTEESDGLQAEASASQQRRPTYPSQHRYPPTWSTCPTVASLCTLTPLPKATPHRWVWAQLAAPVALQRKAESYISFPGDLHVKVLVYDTRC
uniref:CSD domain-containing protein n=1 Tax=Scleropages formosus TaxID=113540 RepID=A0A8C9WFL9_SCLFO